MAGLTGRALSNDLYGMGAQAIEGLSQGGDFLSNYVHFMVNQDRYAAAGGARGVRARTKQQLLSGIRFFQDAGVAGSDAELGAAWLMGQGYNSTQARFLANATLREGGGGNGAAGEAAVLAMEQDQALNRQAAAAARAAPAPFANVRAALGAVMDIGRDSTWETIKATTLAGAGVGSFVSPLGAVVGGLGGLAVGAGIAWARSSGESGLTPEQEELVRSASPKDRQAMVEGFLAKNRETGELKKIEEKFGRIPIDPGNPADVALTNRALRGDFRHSVLDLDATDAVYAKATAALAEASGLHGSETGGPGTIRMGNKYFNIGDVKTRFDEFSKKAQHTDASRKAFESVRAGMTASDAERASQMAETFDKLRTNPQDEGAASRAAATARQILARAGERYAAHPTSPESRAILESTVTAARLGESWRLDPSSIAARGRLTLGLVGALRGHDAATGQAMAETFAEIAAGQQGQGFLHQLGGALLSGETRARRVLGGRLARDEQFRRTVYELAEGTRRGDARRVSTGEKELARIVEKQATSVYGIRGADVARDISRRVEKGASELAHLNEADRRKLLNIRGGDDPHLQALSRLRDSLASVEEGRLTKAGAAATGHHQSRGSGMAENAIGFGAQESAMQHIERSLRATRSALEKLNQRIPGGTPVPPSQSPPKTG
jgi:hypothetical protein